MKDNYKTKKQLITELTKLRQRVAELETAENSDKRVEADPPPTQEEFERRVKERTDGFLKAHEALKHEIAERQRVEEALKESLALVERAKQEWESTADTLSPFIGLLDHNGRLLRANRTIERWGLGRVEDVKDRELHQLFHDSCTGSNCYLKAFVRRAREALAQGRPVECEAEDRFLRRHLFLKVVPILIPSNGVEADTAASAAVAVIQDVTERKRTEAALRKIREELEQRVRERTADLSRVNAALRQEIAERKQAEAEKAHLHIEAQNRARELAALEKAGQAMASTLDLKTVLNLMMIEVTTLLNAEGAAVLLLDNSSNQLTFAAATPASAKSLVGLQVSSEDGIAGWAIHSTEPVLVEDVERDSRFCEDIDSIHGLRTRSNVAVPLIIKEQAVGVVQVINKVSGTFNRHDVEILEALTGSAAIAIENARLYEEIERRTQQLTILHELDRVITTSLRITDVYHALSLYIVPLLPYHHMSLTLLDEDKVHLAYVAGESKVFPAVVTPLNRKNSAPAWVINRGQPLLRHNISTGSQFSDDEHLVDSNIHSSMIIPLRVKGRIIGTWNLGSKYIGAFQADDLSIAQAIADQLAIAIENARLFEEVRNGREQLRQLAQQVVSAHEEEAQRLSHELHDEAGQALISLKMMLELILMDLPVEAESLRGRLSETVTLADTTMERLRALARDLRPPALDAAGLNPTLEELCHDFAGWTGIEIDYTGVDLDGLSDSAKISLYRFLQEALTNVAKHAQAQQVVVQLAGRDQLVTLSVHDNGRGFDKQAALGTSEYTKGIGLVGMQERLELLGGWLEIESQPGAGACLTAHMPLEDI